MIPAPNLLAEPSSPRAMYGLSIQLMSYVCMISKDLPGAFNGDRFLTLPGMFTLTSTIECRGPGVRAQWDASESCKGRRAAVSAPKSRSLWSSNLICSRAWRK